MFGGFEELASGVKLATAEKALFDLAYLSSGRSRIFRSLPEIEIPRAFQKRELSMWLDRVPAVRSPTLTKHALDELLGEG